MPKIRQPHFESLQRYTQTVMITKDGTHLLIHGDHFLFVDEAVVVSKKLTGYTTLPMLRLHGNVYLCRIIVTNELLDWMERLA